MPDSPAVWIVAIIVAALVVAFMVWRGVGGTIAKGGWKLSLDRKPNPDPKISVAEGIEAKKSTIGPITGVKADKSGAVPASEIAVANQAKFSGAQVGAITGVEISGGTKPRPKP